MATSRPTPDEDGRRQLRSSFCCPWSARRRPPTRRRSHDAASLRSPARLLRGCARAGSAAAPERTFRRKKKERKKKQSRWIKEKSLFLSPAFSFELGCVSVRVSSVSGFGSVFSTLSRCRGERQEEREGEWEKKKRASDTKRGAMALRGAIDCATSRPSQGPLSRPPLKRILRSGSLGERGSSSSARWAYLFAKKTRELDARDERKNTEQREGRLFFFLSSRRSSRKGK